VGGGRCGRGGCEEWGGEERESGEGGRGKRRVRKGGDEKRG